MSTMHAAVARMTAAREARRCAHHDTVTSSVQDRSDSQPPAGQHAPAGPAFPIPAQDDGAHGPDSDRH